MYRYFDIDDLGNNSVARDPEIEEFESFSPEWKEYQARWKALVKEGMSKADAKKQAQTELNYKPGQNIFDKIRNVNVGEGEVKVGLKPKSAPADEGAGDAGTGGGEAGGSGTDAPKGLNIAGMTLPWPLVIGVVAVAGYFGYRKFAK